MPSNQWNSIVVVRGNVAASAKKATDIDRQSRINSAIDVV